MPNATQPEDSNKAAGKAAKKAAKAAAKAAKKGRAPATITPTLPLEARPSPSETASSEPVAEAKPSSQPTAAERSALAAERKVLWEQRRFWITVVSVLIALAALLATLLTR
jgi:hypothetical protein